MEIDQIDNQHAMEIYISLVAQGIEVWKMQSEIATGYDYTVDQYISLIVKGMKFWKMQSEIETDYDYTMEKYISLVTKGIKFWDIQSEIATDYDYFGLRSLPFQTTDDELQNVSINITFLHL